MSWLEAKPRNNGQAMAEMIATALAERIDQTSPVIVIGNIDIQINYASGTSAEINVK